MFHFLALSLYLVFKPNHRFQSLSSWGYFEDYVVASRSFWALLKSEFPVILSFFCLNIVEAFFLFIIPVLSLKSTSLNQAWFNALSRVILILGSLFRSLFNKSLHKLEWPFQHGKSNSNYLFKVIWIVSLYDSWSNGNEPESKAYMIQP